MISRPNSIQIFVATLNAQVNHYFFFVVNVSFHKCGLLKEDLVQKVIGIFYDSKTAFQSIRPMPKGELRSMVQY